MSSSSFDPIWETIYGEGRQLNRYPWDVVVSFIFSNYPRTKERKDVQILEIGCGAGSNLWFAAREGFQIAGIDGSTSAIDFAKKRFAAEGLKGDLHVGDFTALPFANHTFDLVIDRGALVCCGLSAGRQAVAEVNRVLLPGGRFFANPYSDTHTSNLSGERGPDGLVLNSTAGTLVNVGQLCFYGRRDVQDMFGSGWSILSQQHLELREEKPTGYLVHAEWRIVAEKIG